MEEHVVSVVYRGRDLGSSWAVLQGIQMKSTLGYGRNVPRHPETILIPSFLQRTEQISAQGEEHSQQLRWGYDEAEYCWKK